MMYYFIIGAIVATICLVHNWVVITRIRKKQHEEYLRYLETTDSGIVAIKMILGTCPVFDVHPWERITFR